MLALNQALATWHAVLHNAAGALLVLLLRCIMLWLHLILVL